MAAKKNTGVAKKETNTKPKVNKPKKGRALILYNKGYVAKSIEMPIETADLLNKIAKEAYATIGDAAVAAIDDLAEKHDMKRSKPKPISIDSVENKYKKLKKALTSFMQTYFHDYIDDDAAKDKLIKYLRSKLAKDSDVKDESFYEMLSGAQKEMLPSFNHYSLFLKAFYEEIFTKKTK